MTRTPRLKKCLVFLCLSVLVIVVFVGIRLLQSEQISSVTYADTVISNDNGINSTIIGQVIDEDSVLPDSSHLLPQSEQELGQVNNSPATTISSNQEVDQVQDNIEACLRGSKLVTQYPQLTAIAKDNSVLFLREYRKVIPRDSLVGYSSHCWNEEYSLKLQIPSEYVEGHIGNLTFSQELSRFWFWKSTLKDFKVKFNGSFHSSTVCLPNTYLLGFEKCGSTFIWCFLSKLVHSLHMETNSTFYFQSDKEPYFWTPYDYELAPPRATQIGNPYLVNYLSAFDPSMKIDTQKKVVLIDGCPSTVIEWPHFNEEDPFLANYCLLPSTLPELFPDSKYVVVIRNPVKMMYSAFWWSFHYNSNSAAHIKKYQGPDIFHKEVMAKIQRFLECMTVESDQSLHHRCNITNMPLTEYSACVSQQMEVLGKCVHNITNHRRVYEAVLHRGIYYSHLIRWMSVLPRSRLLVVVMEELLLDPTSVAQEVLTFFGMADYPLTKEIVDNIIASCLKNNKNNNKVDYSHDPRLKMRADTEELLKKFFFPFNRMLSDLLSAPQMMSLWS